MIRDRTLKPQSAKPSICQIEVRLFAQAPLGSQAIAIADQQHSDHQFGIYRRPPGMAVKWRQLATQTTQIEHGVYLSQEMIDWHPVFEPKFVEQPLLQPGLLSHHPPGPPTD